MQFTVGVGVGVGVGVPAPQLPTRENNAGTFGGSHPCSVVCAWMVLNSWPLKVTNSPTVTDILGTQAVAPEQFTVWAGAASAIISTSAAVTTIRVDVRFIYGSFGGKISKQIK